MGWFGCGPMDGDDGMDLRDEVFGMLGLDGDYDYYSEEHEDHIRETLESRQNEIYDWLRDYDWNSRYNPGFIQEVYIQGFAHLMCEYNARINERGLPVMIDFVKNDHWSKEDEERKTEMTLLLEKLEINRLVLV
jgi:hypothetical protein